MASLKKKVKRNISQTQKKEDNINKTQIIFSHPDEINKILSAKHSNVFAFLGMHEAKPIELNSPIPDGFSSKNKLPKNAKTGQTWVFRTFQPYAEKVFIKITSNPEQKIEASKIHKDGFFETIVSNYLTKPDYKIEILENNDYTRKFKDPYDFPLILQEKDIYHIAEGTHQLYDKFGAQICRINKTRGTSFVVWAPNAKRVSVIGDFNRWDGRMHMMRFRVEVGVWEIFIPGVNSGTHYKFEILTADGEILLKSDPVSFYSQNRTETASLVWDKNRYIWGDKNWLEIRSRRNPYERPVSIYEVNLGSWRRVPQENNRELSYRELASQLIPYVKDMGFTHIELMPVSEHPFDGSWGYQVTGYFAPTSRFGDPDDFKYFIDQCHCNGIGVIMDWVPGHFPVDAHGLSKFDGTALYEHADPRKGFHKEWGTLIFNYGRNEVKNFLIANALFWFDEYHIDGLRVDAVASMLYLDYSREEGEWLPNQHGGRENLEAIDFLRSLNEICYLRYPGILMIAEESTAWGGVSKPTNAGGLGFGFKWNMGWMNDFLSYIEKDPVHRKYHHGEATFSMIYCYDENFVLVLSHDEVVHGKRSLLSKMPGDNWQKFANLRMFLAWMYAHPGKKLLFMGTEIAPWDEWDHDKSLDWHLLDFPEHRNVKKLITDLNHLYREEPALYRSDHKPEGFSWLRVDDAENSIFAFIRKPVWEGLKESDDVDIIVVINATPVVRYNYWLNVPRKGVYREILNTDSHFYGGSNIHNHSKIVATNQDVYSNYGINITIPPLSTLFIQKDNA